MRRRLRPLGTRIDEIALAAVALERRPARQFAARIVGPAELALFPVVDPAQGRGNGRKPDRTREQQDCVTDLVLRRTGLRGPTRMAVNGAFGPDRRGRSELHQLADLRLERPGALDRLAELRDAGEHVGIPLRESLEVLWRLGHVRPP